MSEKDEKLETLLSSLKERNMTIEDLKASIGQTFEDEPEDDIEFLLDDESNDYVSSDFDDETIDSNLKENDNQEIDLGDFF